eukprot:TRINITY_DN1998_c0_g1_i2.p1 TRINITY_DN1998_c0_g1~~TRINITY_DN1998_c0_g1_i2.p1  ORF type:complete len:254 (-),score=62.31 TRINITY_DN1998_c0_g1_i2:1176-1937(-)
MLESVLIFNKFGIVLWSKEYALLRGKPVHKLIKTFLLEERAGQAAFQDERYTVKWLPANEHEILFVIVHQRQLQLPWVDELLEVMKGVFCEEYSSLLKNYQAVDGLEKRFDFDEKFEKLHRVIQQKEKQKPTQRKYEETKKGKEKVKTSKTDSKDKQVKKKNEKETQEDDEEPETDDTNKDSNDKPVEVTGDVPQESQDENLDDIIKKNIAKLAAKKAGAKNQNLRQQLQPLLKKEVAENGTRTTSQLKFLEI